MHFLIFLSAIMLALPACAEIYKCKDSKGGIEYASAPCKGGIVVESSHSPAIIGHDAGSDSNERALAIYVQEALRNRDYDKATSLATTPRLREMVDDAMSRDARKNTRSKTDALTVVKSRINGSFEGWSGETIYELTNGQIWQQSSYSYSYNYSYMPAVQIYLEKGIFKMRVDGASGEMQVRRLR